MAKKLKPGQTVRGYTISKLLAPGAMAISYAAKSPTGERVFFKQYKSPSVTLAWYPAYKTYQELLGKRVLDGAAKHFCVRMLDAFEEVWGGPTYFQVFEFVESGGDLREILDQQRERLGDPFPVPLPESVWKQRLIWARVLMSGVAALHRSKIAHCDLKPENVHLLEDPSIAAGFQLRLIDMDFSVLTDRTAPWHGHQGYVGSNNYRSPEHLRPGAVPGTASDVFTCGLILYEMLTGVHPYWSDDQEEYANAVRAYSAPRPKLAGAIEAPASEAEITDLLHRCLVPNPAQRPAAEELRDALTGRSAAAGSSTAPVRPSTSTPLPGVGSSASPDIPSPSVPAAIRSDRVRLISASGGILEIGVRTELSAYICRQFGDESQFWAKPQCVLEREADGAWRIVPAPGTPNETLLNGRAIDTPQTLRAGDVIAAGREAKAAIKLPLIVQPL